MRPPFRPPPGDDRALRQLTPYVEALTIPPRAMPVADGDVDRLTVRMRTAQIRLHPALPPTTLWTYDGSFPGPTIEVRRNRALHVDWVNELSGPFPVTAVESLDNKGDIREWDLPGRRGAPAIPEVAALPPWVVVHLHGLLTGGGNDGWPENAIGPGDRQLTRYTNDQPACALWYHDHAMHISRLTTMTGLTAGMYLIRDDEEDALGLPSGDREIPLLLCDRTLDTDATGALTGDLLHKVTVYEDYAEKITRSFTGPFTLVNGRIWPYLEVDPVRYRFRVLNAASIRPYHLVLLDEKDDIVADGTIQHVGSDAGLLPGPVAAGEAVVLTPAERGDVVIDFSAHAGRTLRWVDDSPIGAPDEHVLQFRVRAAASSTTAVDRPLPPVLSTSFRSVDDTAVTPLTERLVCITPAFPITARMWEMVPVEAPRGPMPMDGIIQFENAEGVVQTWQRVAEGWNDPVTFLSEANGWESWTYLSLEGPGAPHPMHVHAFTFQVRSRQHIDVKGFEYLQRADGTFGGGTVAPLRWDSHGVVPPEERGWKDVVAVGSGQLVSVTGRFGPSSGRFLHHCHVYEHEDHKMMRPFTVLPAAVSALDPHQH
ncbi:MAG: hypothetical protein ABS81_03045 [Pseudonocardia sp. SCN 72-86]|nr:MAG: hypothetical protein ABS81_03045 [Pseudonocardia sp. SCN 72-86]